MSDLKNRSELAIIWSSSDKEVARNTVFNYALNAKCREWWSDVYLIIWGPSAKLLAENVDVQCEVEEMRNKGIKVSVCADNANACGVCKELVNMGLEVRGIQQPVLEMLARGAKVITF